MACFVGRIGTPELQEVLSEDSTGPVNCVAFSEDGTRLALGRGYYPLSSGPVESAYIEVWQVPPDQPAFCESTVLVPGVCVDFISWKQSLVCLTGLRSQSGGFLIPFDQFFGALRYFDLSRHPARGLVSEYPNAIVLFDDRLVAFCIETGAVRWSLDSGATAMAHDDTRQELVLTSGAIVSTKDGSTIAKLEPLQQCSSVAILPGRGIVGVSQQGQLRVWEQVHS